eukprot:1147024-Pelagomonas_calceolata.AAC.4
MWLQPVATLRVNQLVSSGTASAMPRGGTTSRAPPAQTGPKPDAFYDERMGSRGLKKLERRCVWVSLPVWHPFMESLMWA